MLSVCLLTAKRSAKMQDCYRFEVDSFFFHQRSSCAKRELLAPTIEADGRAKRPPAAATVVKQQKFVLISSSKEAKGGAQQVI